ncbi:MAG: ISAs1 family transposase [Rikenellaceae bacterium]
MSILDFAISVEDFRQPWKVRHLSTDIIFITVAAVICGAKDWEDVEDFGDCKEEFFNNYLALPNGIPSHDTFNRFFSSIKPEVLEKQFGIWVKTLCSERSEIISIDGKTICGAKNEGRSIFHMVSAFCHANGVSLAQVKTAEKSNEITAIPELIKILDLEGCVVTIDAMGCQREIAEDIINAKADYVLAVKGNQKELLQGIEDTFRFQCRDEISFSEELDFGHGRIENRRCYIATNLEHIDCAKWAGVRTLVKVVSDRYIKREKRQEESSVRYYISSLDTDPQQFSNIIRSHWGIENSLHWMLDVSFGEDASRKRAKNSAMNFSLVFKAALAMLKKYRVYPNKRDISIKRKRNVGGWSDKHLIAMMGMEVD